MSKSGEFSPALSDAYEDRGYYCEYMGGAAHYRSKHLHPKFVMATRLAERNCSNIERVLDIGCGRGELVNYYCSHGIEVVGVEYSRTAYEIATALLAKNPHGELATLLNVRDNCIPYPGGYFDVGFMLDVVEHLYSSQLDEYYSQLRRLLRPGGILVIHTWPNRLQREKMSRYEVVVRKMLAVPYRVLFGHSIKRTLRDSCEELVHVNEHTPNQLLAHLASHGFQARVFSSYFGGTMPDSLSDLLGEMVLNVGPLGLVPGLKEQFNRYIWAIATNPE